MSKFIGMGWSAEGDERALIVHIKRKLKSATRPLKRERLEKRLANAQVRLAALVLSRGAGPTEE